MKDHLRQVYRLIILVILIFSCCRTTEPASGQAWSFVSSPDIFNSDIADFSGGTISVINSTFPDPDAYAEAMSELTAPCFAQFGRNGITVEMAKTYNRLLDEMQSNAGGSCNTFLVAGDLVSGHWPGNPKLIDNFGGNDISEAIDRAADIFYSWHRELFRQHGFINYIAAIGDHDIGDNNWPAGSVKEINVGRMKQAFGRTIVDPLGLPKRWNGISSFAPAGKGCYNEGSYVKQVNNVLFVTVDVFRWEPAARPSVLHPWYGAISPEITGSVGNLDSHLGWLDAVLTAADADPAVDHVIVQGHTPVLPSVRKQSSSGMMMQQRDDSPFWHVLRAHEHRNGGKLRLYFGGEVHTTTATKDIKSDIVQLAHGNPPVHKGETNYVVFEVEGKRILARLYRVNLNGDGGNYWQLGKPKSEGVGSMTPGELAGTLTIDASGPATAYSNSGYLSFVDYRGLILNYAFDEGEASIEYTNSGSLQDLYYNAIGKGDSTTQPGKIGRALSTNGNGDYVLTDGGLAPISEGEQRTVGAWIKTTHRGTQAVFGYGQKKVDNGEFNLQLDDGALQLFVDGADGGRVATADNPAINDGKWHHVAIVLPDAHDNTLGDVIFYVDGRRYEATTPYPSQPIRTFAGSKSKIYVGANAENQTTSQNFAGMIDDVAVWGTALAPAKLRALYAAGSYPGLEIETLAMEALFDLFDARHGSVFAKGIKWTWVSGLAGSGGEVIEFGDGQMAIVLDDSGNGVKGVVNSTNLAVQPR